MPTITRRQFNAASIAATLLPSLYVPRQKVRQIDLSLFCNKLDDCGRYKLDLPFLQEGLTYATDLRVCVRTGLDVRMPDGESEGRLPKAAGLTWDHDQRTGWRSLDAVRFVDTDWPQTCHKCNGHGRIGGHEHLDCAGTGYLLIFAGDGFANYEKLCDCRTGWVGGIACPRCLGKGEIKARVDMGGAFIAPAYWAKLRTLGEVEYCVTGREEVVRFRAQDVDGLLMPLSK